jgi:hypothetical protein
MHRSIGIREVFKKAEEQVILLFKFSGGVENYAFVFG